MNVLTTEQLVYLAAFIDGDGSIIVQIVPRKDYSNLFQIRLSVTCVQKIERVQHLEDFKSQIGEGTVRDRGDGIGEYALVGKERVSILLKQLEPLLRIKRKQAQLALEICEKLDLAMRDPYKFLELCELADQVAELNDSKKRIWTKEAVQLKLLDSGKITK